MGKRFLRLLTAALIVFVSVMGVDSKAEAASVSGSKYINATYGTLRGETDGCMGYQEKLYCTQATTTSAVPRIRATLTVCYYTTGEVIGDGETTGWISNASSAVTANYEMHHFKNKLNNNTYDGFVSTKCTAYGAADAITENAYVVYTQVTY